MSKEGLQVALVSGSGHFRAEWLPFPAEGIVTFDGLHDKFKLCARDEQWYLVCSKGVIATDSKMQSSVVGLEEGQFLLIKGCDEPFILYVEDEGSRESVFQSYRCNFGSFSIGRGEDCDIAFNSDVLSKYHAEIRSSGGNLEITDLNSVNGVFVNGERVRGSKVLGVGDLVYIWGLKIIVGMRFVAINSGNPHVRVSQKAFTVFESQSASVMPADDRPQKKSLFNRNPRYKTVLKPSKIEIEAPPMSLNSSNIPLILRMGGSAVMGGASAMHGNFIPLVSSLLFPVLSQKYTDKQKKEYEEKRVSKYTEYLNKKRAEIEAEKTREESILRINHPDLNQVLGYTTTKDHLWERRANDDDFLLLRLGEGELPLGATIDYPRDRFDLDDDELENKMFQLAQREVLLRNVPITLSLVDYPVVGVQGPKRARVQFLKNLIHQITCLHSYDEVKLILLASQQAMRHFNEFRYLPHFWDDNKTVRYIANDLRDVFLITDKIKDQIMEDIEKKRDLPDILSNRPHYVILSLEKSFLEGMEFVKDVMKKDKNFGLSVVSLADSLPKECSVLVDLSSQSAKKLIYLNDYEKADILFREDVADGYAAAKAVKSLSNTLLKSAAEESALPNSATFLEMYGVGNIEQLAIAKNWKTNDPTKRLAVPVGIATDGSTFMLDLHEKFQGPHGLVAGTTGSGKSEFLLTYILSLAINFSPEEVAFVLIDYKGGGLAGAFFDPKKGVHLPHVVGTITNLDGSAIQRNMISLMSEVERRQVVFNEACSIANTGTMNIYQYQKLYRKGVVSEPMPHLFIISDEFAELKQNQPEFMDSLISIARIGRSLGVHLILATQKPAGVVNDQIRSNSKFKVCLKVQDRQDSMDMLMRPEAAELKQIGRFYLQVGYNEFFALGQSGWSGAQYEPQEEVLVKEDNSVQFIDTIGQEKYSKKPVEKKKGTGQSQLVVLVDTITRIAKEQGFDAKMLWEDPLEPIIDVESLAGNASNDDFKIAVGMADDPSQLSRFAYELDFMKMKNLLVLGEGGSGKTSLLQTILLSSMEKYDPSQFNFYAIDFATQSFKSFQGALHCGGLVTEDRTEDLPKLLRVLNEILDERQDLFAELGVENFSQAKELCSLPLVVVMIDNVSALAQTKDGDNFAMAMSRYLKAGPSLGVQFVITASRFSEVNSRVRAELQQRIAFAQKDRYDYTDAIGCKTSFIPPSLPGRGLVAVDGRPLEFQAALFEPELHGNARTRYLKDCCAACASSWQGDDPVKRIPVIREDITYPELLAGFEPGRIPLGFNFKDAREVALPLKQLKTLTLYFGDRSLMAPVLQNIELVANKERAQVLAVKRSSGAYFTDGFACNEEGLQAFKQALLPEFQARVGLFRDICEELGVDKSSEDAYLKTQATMSKRTRPIFVIVENLADWCNLAKGDDASILSSMITYARQYNIYFIGCLFADETSSTSLFRQFNSEELVILFGGNAQNCTALRQARTLRDWVPSSEGHAIMSYRGDFHSLGMPLDIKEQILENDDRPIF